MNRASHGFEKSDRKSGWNDERRDLAAVPCAVPHSTEGWCRHCRADRRARPSSSIARAGNHCAREAHGARVAARAPASGSASSSPAWAEAGVVAPARLFVQPDPGASHTPPSSSDADLSAPKFGPARHPHGGRPRKGGLLTIELLRAVSSTWSRCWAVRAKNPTQRPDGEGWLHPPASLHVSRPNAGVGRRMLVGRPSPPFRRF